MTTRLSNRGFSVVALSGELSQNERTHALQAMRDGRARVCVATDVAARGIDLPNLELVIHAELPTNQDTLLHRSGRTGRAGRKGVSALIVTPANRKKAQRLLGWAKLTADWADAPSADEVTAKDDERMMASSDWDGEVEASNREAVDALANKFTSEQLAAAYVRLYRERRSAPEELSEISAAPPQRAAFGPSVWFSLAGGQAVGAEPRRLLPMLCKMGNISREDVGAIRIHHEASLIELRESAVEGFLSAIGPKMALENGAALSRLDGVPNLDRGPRGEKPRRDKPSGDKPRPSKRPKQEGQSTDAPKPAEGKRPGTTKPVEWNDDPKPRFKKPKGPKKPAGAAKPVRAEATAEGAQAEQWKPRKPRHKSKGPGAGKGPGKPGAPTTGKPSSKKNRARQAAAKAAAGNDTPKARKPRAPKANKPHGNT